MALKAEGKLKDRASSMRFQKAQCFSRIPGDKIEMNQAPRSKLVKLTKGMNVSLMEKDIDSIRVLRKEERRVNSIYDFNSAERDKPKQEDDHLLDLKTGHHEEICEPDVVTVRRVLSIPKEEED
ncbi:hypothetical protein Nepgr_027862 [Nepenthes gracilis]|uniref:Uncharacterized protein n=1 Tax=Nepenthes gracilis TaxID=150966 RepID=A0AAD3TB45_NEPGR|nr:hypothetical protein Nepgr_027862 [Nepenthes gracilis]